MNIILLTEKDQISTNVYKVNDDRFIHIKNILKLKADDIIEIGLLNGPTGNAKIIGITEAEVSFEISSLKPLKETSIKVDIICALPRPQTLKKVLSTCATIGVSNLYLIRSERVEKSYFHSPLLEEGNYTKFFIEGLSQGKRTNIPKVTIYKKFKEFFENYFDEVSKNAICLLADPSTENYLNRLSFLYQKKIILAIGPEGGWNEFEINFMEERGFVKFKLSESILRVENAVTAALAQIELQAQINKKVNKQLT